VFQMFLIRILGAGPYSHFLYTGLVGMGIASWYVRDDLSGARRALVAAGYVAAGWACHFLWNSPLLVSLLGEGRFWSWVVFVTAKGLPMLIGFAIVVNLARKRERRWFAGLAAAFADDGAITDAERATLSGLRSRRRVRKAARRTKGSEGEQVMGQIQRAQLDLARTFSRSRSEADPAVIEAARKVMRLKRMYEELGSAPG
jgi:protease PrsW